MTLEILSWQEKDNEIMQIIKQDFKGLGSETTNKITDLNMDAEWKNVSVTNLKEGTTIENQWYLIITPKTRLGLSGDFLVKVKIDSNYSFYFWLNVAAIMWNKDL